MLNGSSHICSAILVESIKDKMGLLWQPALAPHKQQYTRQQKQNTETRFCWLYGMLGAYMFVQVYNPLVINQLRHESRWICNIFLASIPATYGLKPLLPLFQEATVPAIATTHPSEFPRFPDPISFMQSLQCIKFFDMDFCLLFFPPPFLSVLGDTSDT